ncbi:MAG: hypothetical protein HOP29_02190 [Phycisphaerales bacterium]|nr:hypothetical protein [Phycisphaerales bacterium]
MAELFTTALVRKQQCAENFKTEFATDATVRTEIERVILREILPFYHVSHLDRWTEARRILGEFKSEHAGTLAEIDRRIRADEDLTPEFFELSSALIRLTLNEDHWSYCLEHENDEYPYRPPTGARTGELESRVEARFRDIDKKIVAGILRGLADRGLLKRTVRKLRSTRGRDKIYDEVCWELTDPQETTATGGEDDREKLRDKATELERIRLTDEEWKVLEKLDEESPHMQTLTQLEASTRMTAKTVGLCVNQLIADNLASRPRGPKSGAAITPTGQDLIQRKRGTGSAE